MKKTIIAIIFFLVIAALVIMPCYEKWQREEIEKLESYVAHLKEETVPLKFVIRERKNNRLKVDIKFYNLKGETIDRTRVELQGHDLSVDFYMVRVKDRFLAFPYKVFTETMKPKNGVLLTSYYDKNGFPQIFYSDDIKKEERNALITIFSDLKDGKRNFEDNEFGNLIHDIKNLGSFKIGYVYKVVAHTKGGIEVILDTGVE